MFPATIEAIQSSYSNATETWKEQMHECVKATATVMPEFTVLDVHTAREVLGIPKPATARSMGGVMLRAAKAGFITKSGQAMKDTIRESHHDGWVSVWNSSLC